MPFPTEEHLRAFAARGYAVIPGIVPHPLLDTAMREIDGLIELEPPPADRQGFHFYWRNHPAPADPLLVPLTGSPALAAVEAMVSPLRLERPRQVQVSLNIPPYRHRPGGPHLDGLTPLGPDGQPYTFTMLACVFLTDQVAEDMGNLWVWPGSPRVLAAHFREHGPDALLGMAHPTIELPPPEQVVGRAGDLFLGHYLLGHNMGGNLSATVRRVLYYRLRAEGHASRWRDCVQDALLEFAPVRALSHRPDGAGY